MKQTPIRIIIFEDHAVVREGLIALLSTQSDMQVVAHASNGSAAVELFRAHQPDIVLMDLGMPGKGGLQATAELCAEFSRARVIVLTIYSGDEDVHRALQAGAKGYLLKESMSSQLFDAIRTVHSGLRYLPPDIAALLAERIVAPQLSARELEILRIIANGKSNKQVAADLNISEATVKGHVTSILEKLGVNDRTEAVVVALKRGILHIE